MDFVVQVDKGVDIRWTREVADSKKAIGDSLIECGGACTSDGGRHDAIRNERRGILFNNEHEYLIYTILLFFVNMNDNEDGSGWTRNNH